MNIQWYPGHMAKAVRLMKEEIKNVDIILVMGDARAVKRSVNADFFGVINNKKYVLVFNKSDLADETVNRAWQAYYKKNGISAFFIDCLNKKGLKELTSYLKSLSEKFRFEREVRVMVTGIPNVGKSMFINTVAKRAGAQTGDKPGVTRAKQWIKVEGDFYLLDTPGVLPPKFETEEDGIMLAAIGSVKDTIIDREELALKIIDFMKKNYPQEILSRYKLDVLSDESLSIYEDIALKRGYKIKGGQVDYERTAYMILDEFRSGAMGRVSFDRPDAGGDDND